MPGFLVGSEAEQTGVIREGMTLTTALYSSQMPRFTCIIRRAFGVAGQAMITSNDGNDVGINVRLAWPSADWGSLPLEGGIEAAYGRQLRSQPDGGEAMKAELFENMEKIRSPFRTADGFGIEDIIDPRDTRRLACEWVEMAYTKLAHGDLLGPKPGFYRP
jgi:acetyl-CoA carboxylase carboxyltransferase component